MKIAFTSTDGTAIDEHFGRSQSFFIWDVGPEQARFVTKVSPDLSAGNDDQDEEDRILLRAEALADCAIVFAMQIGGPAAAKLTARRILPMKTGSIVSITTMIGDLQKVLRSRPPPWLRKAMERGRSVAVAGEK